MEKKDFDFSLRSALYFLYNIKTYSPGIISHFACGGMNNYRLAVSGITQ